MKLFTILLNIAKRIKTAFSRLTTLETWQSGVADYIVGQSINTNGDGGSQGYTKWASGKMECWVNVIRSTNPTTTWGNLKYGNVSSIQYGQTFIDTPMVNVVIRNGSLWLLCAYPNKTETGTMYACCAGNVSVGSTSSWVSVYAVGKWK